MEMPLRVPGTLKSDSKTPDPSLSSAVCCMCVTAATPGWVQRQSSSRTRQVAPGGNQTVTQQQSNLHKHPTLQRLVLPRVLGEPPASTRAAQTFLWSGSRISDIFRSASSQKKWNYDKSPRSHAVTERGRLCDQSNLSEAHNVTSFQTCTKSKAESLQHHCMQTSVQLLF